MLSMMAFPMIKKVTIVDEDIDAGSLRDVEWAVVTRCEADRDVLIIPDLQGQIIDPLAFQGRGVAKIGIDATTQGKRTEGRARVVTGNPANIGRLLQSIGGVR
jgi:2,5-furandicarboxylate decarboxylase 1